MEHAYPQDPELPRDLCPEGCRGFTTYPVEWHDGQAHYEDTRCNRCGAIWKQGTSPNKRG